MADGMGADGIVNNYLSYFKLHIKYMQNNLNSDDSAQIMILANLCPLIDGAVEHEAKALHNVVFNKLGNFDDACGSDTSMTYRYGKSGHNRNESLDFSKQSYQLFPNPTNGFITLTQNLLDVSPVNIVVYNAQGEKIDDFSIQFLGYSYSLQLGKLPPGLYLIHLTNSVGNSYNLKFIIN